jgi:hypothetical protein
VAARHDWRPVRDVTQQRSDLGGLRRQSNRSHATRRSTQAVTVSHRRELKLAGAAVLGDSTGTLFVCHSAMNNFNVDE